MLKLKFWQILLLWVAHFSVGTAWASTESQPQSSVMQKTAEGNPNQGFTPFLKVQNSQILSRQAVLVESQADWLKLWKSHQGNLDNLPPVNFRENRVIALFMGQKPTAGYQIGIEKIQDHQVYIQIKSPPPDAFVAQVVTTPAFFALLPRGESLKWVWPPDPKQLPGQTLSFQTLSQITNSLIIDARFVIARDSTSFRQLWHLHRGNTNDLPEVDFKQLMVIGIFMGEQATGGYQIKITRIEALANKLKVYYQEIKPSPDAMVIQILTAPAHLVVLEKTDLPVEMIKQP